MLKTCEMNGTENGKLTSLNSMWKNQKEMKAIFCVFRSIPAQLPLSSTRHQHTRLDRADDVIFTRAIQMEMSRSNDNSSAEGDERSFLLHEKIKIQVCTFPGLLTHCLVFRSLCISHSHTFSFIPRREAVSSTRFHFPCRANLHISQQSPCAEAHMKKNFRIHLSND